MYIYEHIHVNVHTNTQSKLKSVAAVFMIAPAQSTGYAHAPHGYTELVQANPSRDWTSGLQDASCMIRCVLIVSPPFCFQLMPRSH